MSSKVESFCFNVLNDTSDFFGETSGSTITTKIKVMTVVIASVIGVIVAHVGLSLLSGNVVICAVAGLSLAAAGVMLSAVSLILLIKFSRFYVQRGIGKGMLRNEEMVKDPVN
ncbi:hypothetical protein [Chlamydiifrater volucris]|uniref:hypothetical protein n=1 Tax=Chlamydiifrater volucris TaxID=2681470 RepID=UPI0032B1874D